MCLTHIDADTTIGAGQHKYDVRVVKGFMNFRYQVTSRLVRWLAGFVPSEFRQSLKNKLKAELRTELKAELKAELKTEVKTEVKVEVKAELKTEFETKLVPMVMEAVQRQVKLSAIVDDFKQRVDHECGLAVDEDAKSALVERLSNEWRMLIRQAAGLAREVPQTPSLTELIQEIGFLRVNQELLAPAFIALAHKRVLFAGQAYYNAWYLSRALRNRGWKADVLNWDMNPTSQIYYHGEDISFNGQSPVLTEQMLQFYVSSLYAYDIFHFSNAHGICFGLPAQNIIEQYFSKHAEITLLKELGRKIVYSNNGCLDGVSQTAFAKWGPESVCSICRWKNEPTVCSDERNLAWGQFRNSVADYQCLLGGNRADFNEDPRVHEVPEFYCLDKEIWHPQIEIPQAFRLPPMPEGTIWLYHAVGHKADRTTEDGVNIKSSHVYLPLIKKLKDEGLLLELLEPTGVPNKDVRFFQAQVDIFLDMLTFGWFGANAREAMMLGKPVICYIRPEWLESVRHEIPDYAAELPIIGATPDTVEGILRDLIANREKRREIGQRSRKFAVKWHSAEAGGRRFEEIYSKLLQGDSLLRVPTKLGSAHE
jgi:hypothetical protein